MRILKSLKIIVPSTLLILLLFLFEDIVILDQPDDVMLKQPAQSPFSFTAKDVDFRKREAVLSDSSLFNKVSLYTAVKAKAPEELLENYTALGSLFGKQESFKLIKNIIIGRYFTPTFESLDDPENTWVPFEPFDRGSFSHYSKG